MRVIDIPAPVTCKLPQRDGSERDVVRTFLTFLDEACGQYEPFAQGAKNGRQYDKLMRIIEACTPDAKSIQFEDADFEVLVQATEKAQWVTPKVNRAFIPFRDAIERAQRVDVPGKKE